MSNQNSRRLKVYKKTQIAANVVFIVTAPLFVLVALLNFIYPKQEPNIAVPMVMSENSRERPARTPVVVVGQKVPLEAGWTRGDKNLVLYLSKTCRYCHESIPFYKALTEKVRGTNVHLVAVLSQEPDDAKAYFKSNNLNISTIYKSSFASIGVTSTPTIMLANKDGVITEYWRGKLSPEKEADLLVKVLGS